LALRAVVGLTRASAPAVVAALLESSGGIPMEVTLVAPPGTAPPGIPTGWRVLDAEGGGFSAVLVGVAAAATDGHVLVIEPGAVPRRRCIPELVAAALRSPAVGLAGARGFDRGGAVVEAGVLAGADGSLQRYGSGGDPRDPRWQPTRQADAVASGAYVVRADLLRDSAGQLALGHPEDMRQLGLAARAAGLLATCPAGAWVEVPDTRAAAGQDAGGVPPQEPRPAGSGRRALRPAAAAGVLFCDRWVPRPDHHAGERRMVDLMQIARGLGSAVTLTCFSGLRAQPYTGDLEAAGIEVFTPPLDTADITATLRSLARERSDLYDMVLVPWPELFDRAHGILRELFPRARLVYDAIDLHHVRLEQQQSVTGAGAAEAVAARRLEIAAVSAADLTLTVSEAERQALLTLVPSARVQALPLVYPLAGSSLPGGRGGMLFVGGFGHAPNVDAVAWFAAEVLPLVEGARLLVVGPNPPPEVRALAGPRVEVVGHVADIDRYYDAARVFVSPLRFGAGVKGKNVQALARGLPLVTTTVGAEGIDLRDGVEAFVEDDPGEFATAVKVLLHDDQRWQAMAQAQLTLAARDHAPAVLAARFGSILEDARSRAP
jgi:glycosyltransferase involved in cell wall biosynthesis